MPTRKSLDNRSLWYELRTQSANQPNSQPDPLDDLNTMRESAKRAARKRPSKFFHDLLRWEMNRIREIMAGLRAERLEALQKSKYDPLAIETDFVAEDGTWLDPTQIEHGDVLRDPKVRPAGYVHPILRVNFETEIEKMKET